MSNFPSPTFSCARLSKLKMHNSWENQAICGQFSLLFFILFCGHVLSEFNYYYCVFMRPRNVSLLNVLIFKEGMVCVDEEITF